MKITICCFHDCFEKVSAWPTPAGSSFEEASQCKSCFRRRGSQAARQTFLPDLWSQSSPTVRSVFVWEWHTYSPRSLRGEVLRMEYPKKCIVSELPSHLLLPLSRCTHCACHLCLCPTGAALWPPTWTLSFSTIGESTSCPFLHL